VSYLVNVDAHTGDNLAGLLDLRIVRASEVSAIGTPSAGSIYGNIDLLPSAQFVRWYATLESPRISSQTTQTREGSTKRNTLPFIIPKDRPGVRAMLERMMDDEFVVLFKYPNGQQKIFGQKHAPVLFSFDHDSGAEFSSRNGYECRFYYQGPDNIFFYFGSTPAPPSGPAPAIVNINGNFLAQLLPGQTLNIDSDFDFNDFQITT
jgi:hypothetical protein